MAKDMVVGGVAVEAAGMAAGAAGIMGVTVAAGALDLQ